MISSTSAQFASGGPQRATIEKLDSILVDEARALGVNVFRACERGAGRADHQRASNAASPIMVSRSPRQTRMSRSMSCGSPVRPCSDSVA